MAQVRDRMKGNAYVFARVGESSEDAEVWNQRIQEAKFERPLYKIQLDPGSATVHTIELNSATAGNPELSLKQSLAPTPVGSAHIYDLTVEAAVLDREAGVQTTFIEQWNIDADCKAHLAGIRRKKAVETADEVRLETVEDHLEGKAGSVIRATGHAAKPIKGVNISWLNGRLSGAEFNQFLTQHAGQIFFSLGDPKIPIYLVEAKTAGASSVKLPFTGLSLNVETFNVTVHLTPTSPSRVLLGISEDRLGFVRSLTDSYEEWTLDEATWSQARLQSSERSARHTYEVDPSVTTSLGRFESRLRISRELSYENLAAYWTEISKTGIDGDSAGWKFEYILEPRHYGPGPGEEAERLVDVAHGGENLPPSLRDTKFVQTSLPEVRAMVAGLKPSQNNRLARAGEIIALVNQKLKFDEQSVSDEKVYMLSTADILARKTGVCQHFANLFEAIARAAGLPTRIVRGYVRILTNGPHPALKGDFGPHAWNEIEIRPGVWRPIDATSNRLEFLAEDYVPVGSGEIYENGVEDDKAIAVARAMFATQFHLQYVRLP